MTNHYYHLVIATLDGNLSKGMRQLNGVFAHEHGEHGIRSNFDAPGAVGARHGAPCGARENRRKQGSEGTF